MSLFTNPSNLILWQDLIKAAEDRCSVNLEEDLEVYLTVLLARYVNKPEVAKQILAEAFLEALNHSAQHRVTSLQTVGDQCLIFAGLFPRAAARKHVNIAYFVDMGRSAYSAISKAANDLFACLALHFVVLMDVLQSIGPHEQILLPLEAYDQWNAVGSRRAYKILQEYSKAIPLRTGKH